MSDNMQGLYSSPLDAFEAGRRSGADDALRIALRLLSEISAKHEVANDVSAFRAAEECCKAVFDLRSEKKLVAHDFSY